MQRPPRGPASLTGPAAPHETTDEELPTPARGVPGGRPIWVKVSVITALVLLGIFLSSMLLAAVGIGDESGGDHGSGQNIETDGGDAPTDHGSGGDHGAGNPDRDRGHGSGGDHGSGGSSG